MERVTEDGPGNRSYMLITEEPDRDTRPRYIGLKDAITRIEVQQRPEKFTVDKLRGSDR